MYRHFIRVACTSVAALLAVFALFFILPNAQAQDQIQIDNLRKDVSYLNSRVCNVKEPTDPAAKKVYDDQKQALTDAAAALIAALDQQKDKLSGNDFDTTLRKQKIDDEEKSLKQTCPALPDDLQKVVNAATPAAAAPTKTPKPGTGQTVIITNPTSGTLNFAAQTVGTISDPQQVTLTNHNPPDNSGLTVWYEDLPDFRVTENTCNSVPVPDQGSCSFKVAFAPTVAFDSKNRQQLQGNIWIIPTQGWKDYQGLWGQYHDTYKVLEGRSADLGTSNAVIKRYRTSEPPAGAAGAGKAWEKKDWDKETDNSAATQKLNLEFCQMLANRAINPELTGACNVLKTVVDKAKQDLLQIRSKIDQKRSDLRQNPLAVIPLTGAPIHWKYPLTRAVVGLDLSAVSSQTVRQAYFVDFNLLAPFKFPWFKTNEDALESRWWFWLNSRITSLPKAADPSAISTIDEAGTFFTNFSGTGKTADIAQGFDVNGGVELALIKPRAGIPWWGEFVNTQARLGISAIVGGGIATPFSIPDTDVTAQVNQSICDAFKAPAGATVSTAAVAAPGLVCTAASGTPPQVQVMAPNPSGSGTVNDQFITFFTPERSRFFRRYYAGVRLKTYFFSPDVKGDCKPPRQDRCDAPYDIFPGIIDVTAGKDEAVTAGKLIHVLLRIEGVYPLPFVPGLHVFGSIYTAFRGNSQSQPFNTFIVNTPASGVANDANTFRFPLNPLDRDYFRIGVGVDLIQLLKRNKGGQPTTTTSTSSSQSGNSGSSTTTQSGSSTTP